MLKNVPLFKCFFYNPHTAYTQNPVFLSKKQGCVCSVHDIPLKGVHICGIPTAKYHGIFVAVKVFRLLLEVLFESVDAVFTMPEDFRLGVDG